MCTTCKAYAPSTATTTPFPAVPLCRTLCATLCGCQTRRLSWIGEQHRECLVGARQHPRQRAVVLLYVHAEAPMCSRHHTTVCCQDQIPFAACPTGAQSSGTSCHLRPTPLAVRRWRLTPYFQRSSCASRLQTGWRSAVCIRLLQLVLQRVVHRALHHDAAESGAQGTAS
jgi:hypothetical protein